MTRLSGVRFNGARHQGTKHDINVDRTITVKPSDPPRDAPQHSSLRSTLMLALVLAVVAGGTAMYSMFFVPVRYEIDVQPETLSGDPGAEAELQVYGVSRVGRRAPWSRQVMQWELVEGSDLVELSSNEDSTTVFIKCVGGVGLVTLRIRIPDWPFPLLAEFHLAAPVAAIINISQTVHQKG